MKMQPKFLNCLLRPAFIFLSLLLSAVSLIGSSFAFPDNDYLIAFRTSQILTKATNDPYRRVFFECSEINQTKASVNNIEQVVNKRLYQKSLFFSVAKSTIIVENLKIERNIIPFSFKNESDYYFLEDIKFFKNKIPSHNIKNGVVVSERFLSSQFPNDSIDNAIGKEMVINDTSFLIDGVYTYGNSNKCTNFSFNQDFSDAVFLNSNCFFSIFDSFRTFFSLTFDFEINKSMMAVAHQFSKNIGPADIPSNEDFFDKMDLKTYFQQFDNDQNIWYKKTIGYLVLFGGYLSILLYIVLRRDRLVLPNVAGSYNYRSAIYISRILFVIIAQFLLYWVLQLICASLSRTSFLFVFGNVSNWLFFVSLVLPCIVSLRYLLRDTKVEDSFCFFLSKIDI